MRSYYEYALEKIADGVAVAGEPVPGIYGTKGKSLMPSWVRKGWNFINNPYLALAYLNKEVVNASEDYLKNKHGVDVDSIKESFGDDWDISDSMNAYSADTIDIRSPEYQKRIDANRKYIPPVLPMKLTPKGEQMPDDMQWRNRPYRQYDQSHGRNYAPWKSKYSGSELFDMNRNNVRAQERKDAATAAQGKPAANQAAAPKGARKGPSGKRSGYVNFQHAPAPQGAEPGGLWGMVNTPEGKRKVYMTPSALKSPIVQRDANGVERAMSSNDYAKMYHEKYGPPLQPQQEEPAYNYGTWLGGAPQNPKVREAIRKGTKIFRPSAVEGNR